MQEEEEQFVQIIKDSKRKLLVLKLLSNFFNHQDLISVFIRTKIIHNLFEKNRTLEISKLELFHIQYTSSLIDLFQKIKKSKEQQYLLINDEIYINEDFIKKLEFEIGETRFKEQLRVHANLMSQKLESLYKGLVEEKTDVFSWDGLVRFSNSIKKEYYREITIKEYEQLVCLNRLVYETKFAKIERKLMGRLNIFKFKIKFLCGLICNNEFLEIYEFVDTNDKFVFINNDKEFYLLEENDLSGIDISSNFSVKNNVLEQLRYKNEKLRERLNDTKSSLTDEVLDVLKSYLTKVSTVDFIEDLENVDEQTNILKEMLKINIK